MSKSSKKTNGKRGRRKFLKTVALGAGALALPERSTRAAATGAGGSPEGSPRSHQEATSGAGGGRDAIDYPRVFRGDQRRMLAFPLGGVGAGSISLGGRGDLREWWIFNRPDKGNNPTYAFPAIWAQAGGGAPVARVLEARYLPPY